MSHCNEVCYLFCYVVNLKSKVTSAKYEDELMAGSDEDTHDAYLEQMKAEGAERDEDESESSEGGNDGDSGDDDDDDGDGD